MLIKFRLQYITNIKYFKWSENIVSKESFTKKNQKQNELPRLCYKNTDFVKIYVALKPKTTFM